MKFSSIVRATLLVVFATFVVTNAQAQCDNVAGLRPDPTGQGRYWLTGRTAPLSVFTTPQYEGNNSLKGLQLMTADRAGVQCVKVWNEFPDIAREVILSPNAALMVDIDRDQITPMYLDGCRMHGKRFYNRIYPSETPAVAEVEAPPPPKVNLPATYSTTPGQPISITIQQAPITVTSNNTNNNKNEAKSNSISASVASAVNRVIDNVSDRVFTNQGQSQRQGQRQGMRGSTINNSSQRQQRQRPQTPVFNPQKCDGPCTPGQVYNPWHGTWSDGNGNPIPAPTNIPTSGRHRP